MSITIPMTRRQSIYDFFRNHPGERLSATEMRRQFGTAFHKGVREINLDPRYKIVIVHEVKLTRYGSSSQWWAEKKNV